MSRRIVLAPPLEYAVPCPTLNRGNDAPKVRSNVPALHFSSPQRFLLLIEVHESHPPASHEEYLRTDRPVADTVSDARRVRRLGARRK